MNDRVFNSTGCKFLDKCLKEASPKQRKRIKWVAEICLRFCPYDECQIDSRDNDLTFPPISREISECYYQCPACGATETLTFENGKLVPTGKFFQKGDEIWHMITCGRCQKVGG